MPNFSLPELQLQNEWKVRHGMRSTRTGTQTDWDRHGVGQARSWTHTEWDKYGEGHRPSNRYTPSKTYTEWDTKLSGMHIRRGIHTQRGTRSETHAD